jgi:RNA polymerase sigma-70 factor (ECF subfamily)
MKKSSFENILYEYKDRVFSYSFYVLGNREDAEDVTQEVFVRLWENLEEIDSYRCGAWIMRVAHNLCVDRAREYNKTVHRHIDLDGIKAKETMNKSDSRTDPGSGLEFRETQRALLRALKDLPAKTRSLLVLHYYHGMKYKVIGEMLNSSTNAIKVEVHRGRRRLKEILVNEYPEEVEKA